MIRTVIRIAGAAVLALGLAAPASAQVVQSFQFGIGGFFPRGFDGRTAGDTLVENLVPTQGDEPLLFEIGDFKNASVFGEWNVAFGDHIEVGAGISFYKRSVPSLYRDVVNEDFTEIEQDLTLRMVPVTGVVRFLPFGRADSVQPYVGVGLSAISWRYSEVGQFVDTFDYSIFDARFIDSGTTVGPVVLGGVRFPVKGDVYGLTLEYRYQIADADLDPEVGFLGQKIDLGGGTLNFGFLIRF